MTSVKQFEPPQIATAGVDPSAPLRGERARAFLLPGQVHASKDPTEVVTILGSCVAVCLWDTKLSIGGVNHFLLPLTTDAGKASSRFGDIATRTLLEMLQALGSKPQDLVAKIFGGSAMFRRSSEAKLSLGEKNVQRALELMSAANIKVIAQDTGGSKGRRLVFHTDSGQAWTRYV